MGAFDFGNLIEDRAARRRRRPSAPSADWLADAEAKLDALGDQIEKADATRASDLLRKAEREDTEHQIKQAQINFHMANPRFAPPEWMRQL
jgi:hypothetical protein